MQLPMQNLFLAIYFILPCGVIGLFPVCCWLLMCDSVVRYLIASGIRTFHQEVISIVVRYKQRSHGRAAIGITHAVKKLVIEIIVLLF